MEIEKSNQKQQYLEQRLDSISKQVSSVLVSSGGNKVAEKKNLVEIRSSTFSKWFVESMSGTVEMIAGGLAGLCLAKSIDLVFNFQSIAPFAVCGTIGIFAGMYNFYQKNIPTKKDENDVKPDESIKL